MKIRIQRNSLVMAALVLMLAACGGGDDSAPVPPPAPPPPPPTGIGSAGGTVNGPNGAKVEIPAGALTTTVNIVVEQTTAGSPALPGEFSVAGSMYAFTPHGTTFAVPVTITVPYDAAAVPAGVAPTLFKTNAQGAWEPVASATFGANTVTAQLSSFSLFQPMRPNPTVERKDPHRDWYIDPVNQPIERSPEVDLGGKIHVIRPFGTNGFFTFDGDDTRTLEVFSSTKGETFWASAEDVGEAFLRQSQKFVKLTENATLRFVITAGLLEALDLNLPPGPSECPRGLDATSCCPMLAMIQFTARAQTPLGELLLKPNGEPSLDTSGLVSMFGRAGQWGHFVGTEIEHTTFAWDHSQVFFSEDVDNHPGLRHPRVRLSTPIVFNVDMSMLDVGDDFRVISTVYAYAVNERGRESALGAYIRDPAKIGGSSMEFTGLEPVDDAAPAPFVPRPGVPCSSGPDPAAGEVQFSKPVYAFLESKHAGVADHGIFVIRTGGSTGAISAKISTGGGTAIPEEDYVPLDAIVHFPDGDTGQRLVSLDVLQDSESGLDKTVVLTLSEPGGCAVIGTQAEAVLTLLDDDRPPPPPLPSGLDPLFGTEGKVTTAFGGKDTAMALQADGKIVLVGGSTSDFVLARYDLNGSLDEEFGVGGTVTTNMIDGTAEEVARSIAIQSDGKIVVAGYTGVFGRTGRPAGNRFDFAVTRYDTDGTLDETFGTDGVVNSGVIGRAFAVAIQPDGKIVVAGDAPLTEDIVVARYLENGTLDGSFAGTGQLTTDINGGAELARNVVIQSNNTILVSGPHTKADDIARERHTVLVRYGENGAPDNSFGTAGEAVLSDAQVGQGLALQSDGKLLLVGSVDVGVAPSTVSLFALMRLLSDGTPDGTFGTAGAVSTFVSDLGDVAEAVAVQADGKILVSGRSSIMTNSNFALARFEATGALDDDFGLNGRMSVDFFGFTDSADSVAVQPDGKIVLGGLARDNVDGYGLARVLP